MSRREELRGKSPRALRSKARILGVNENSEREALIEEVLEAEWRWWDAMRRLRTLEGFSSSSDDEIIRAVEMAGNGPGTATAGDLEAFWRDVGVTPSDNVAKIPAALTRSEVLVELAKFPELRSLSFGEIEERTPREGPIPTARELTRFLESFGGPSSSDPERTLATTAEALEELRRSWRFRGMGTMDVLGEVDEMVDLEGGLNGIILDSVARGFASWGAPRQRVVPPESPRVLLELLRETPKFWGGTDSEIIDAIEGSGGPVVLEDLERELGRQVSREASPPPEEPEGSWWDAMRKVRTLESVPPASDSVVVSGAEAFGGLSKGAASTHDLSRYFDALRLEGVLETSRINKMLHREEVLVELSKFRRYEGMSPKEVAGGLPTRDLKARLRALGGPSSSSPRVSRKRPLE